MQVNITNALWAEKTYTFEADFLDTLAENYGAGVNLLDFLNTPDPSRLTINAWVADQTNTTDSKRESSVGVHGHVHQAVPSIAVCDTGGIG